MDFTKIKRSKDGEVVLRWKTEAGKDSTVHELTSFDNPEPEFTAALQAFVPEVLALLELPSDYGKGMTVIGVSLSHNDDQGTGIVVTCLKELTGANAPLVLNTPHLPEMSEHGPTISSAMLGALVALEDRAKRYIAGNREKQMDMLDPAA
jgi:hypothetical protein